jgi:hypothetical protein
VWRRLQVATAAGAMAAGVTAAGLGASATAGAKVAAKTVWATTALQWTAVALLGLPVAGAAVHLGARRATIPASNVALHAAPALDPRVDLDPRAEPPSQEALAPTLETPPAPAEVAAPIRGRAAPPPSINRDAASALHKESLALGAARSKFAAGDARAALDAVNRMSAEFPRGRLVQEREVLAIDCLDAIGDRDGTRARARRFLDRFPESPYAAHVRSLGE